MSSCKSIRYLELYFSFSIVQNARFHPSSCIRPSFPTPGTETEPKLPSDWLIYDEINVCGELNLVKGCTLVTTAAVALFGGNLEEDFAKPHYGNCNYGME